MNDELDKLQVMQVHV